MCPAQQIFAIVHPSDIAMTRRCGTQLATEMGFDETTAGRLALVITEAATNILKHAGEGCILLAPRPGVTSGMIEVLALDKGPGMTDMGNSLRDGLSTTGTSGTGLGAMKRQANHFDAYTQPGRGTGIYKAVHPPAYQPP